MDRKRIRIKVHGELHLLPESLQDVIRKIEHRTAAYSNFLFNVCFAYTSTCELDHAVERCADDVRGSKLDPRYARSPVPWISPSPSWPILIVRSSANLL